MGLLDSLLLAFSGETGDNQATENGPFNLPPRDRVDPDRRAKILAEHYDELSEEQAADLAEILQFELDGSTYSPGNIRRQFTEIDGLESNWAREIANVEITSIQLEESVHRYLLRDFETEVERLLPGDGDVHPVCEATAMEVDEHDGVSVADLHTILKQQPSAFK